MSWEASKYPEGGQKNEQCNTPLDACNYERQTWSGNGTGFNSKYQNKLWGNFWYDMIPETNTKGFYYYPKGTSRTKNSNHNFYPTTKITNNTTGNLDTTFNLANGFDNDVYTNKNIKLDTQISLVTDKTWGVRDYKGNDKYITIPSRYSFFAYGGTKNLQEATSEIGYNSDLMGQMRVKHRVLKIADNDKKVQLDRYTKGQVYIFYKPNIDYVEIENNTGVKLTGNFWYFVTITGKENAITANSGIKATVPYGHIDRTIIDDTIAKFGTSKDDYTDHSHYLSGGQPKVGFPLNEIMKTHDSAAYAIRVTNKYDNSGMGYEIIGSIFEDTSKDALSRAQYTPKYHKDTAGVNIKLEWS
jgi:hypothetical protein